MKTRFEEVIEAAEQSKAQRLAQREEEKAARKSRISAPVQPVQKRGPKKPQPAEKVFSMKTQKKKKKVIDPPPPTAAPVLSDEAQILLSAMCKTGFFAYIGSLGPLDELLRHEYVVRVSGDVYVITRAGRLAGSGQDAPVFDHREKRRL
jgi:septal ring-binding cell division protein DamX